MKVLAVIPARYASTRFPGKPLVDILGKSMIQRVYEQTKKSAGISKVVVATDDQRIFDHVKAFGGEVLMTSENCPSGTDRVGEVMQNLPEFDVYVNVQGDEPFVEPEQIELAIQPFLDDQTVEVSTLIKKIDDANILQSDSCVKVVLDKNNNAIYFSRAIIPFQMNTETTEYLNHASYFEHMGIYAFRKPILEKIIQMEVTDLEQLENLEQLRWLYNGIKVRCALTDSSPICIDTPEDLERAIACLKNQK